MTRSQSECIHMTGGKQERFIRCNVCGNPLFKATCDVKLRKRRPGDEGKFFYCRKCKTEYVEVKE